MNKRLVTIGLIILAVSLVLALVVSLARKIKIDEFRPAAVMFVVDSSASNQAKLPEQKKTLRQICSILDPEDQIKIIKVSEDSYLIYEGTPHNNSGITKAMDAFTEFEPEDYGTAYGVGLKKAMNHALTMYGEGYIPAVVVIGDLENEGAVEKQINWDTLAQNVANVKAQAPELSMMFLYAHPEKLDKVKEILTPVLGETKLVISPEQTIDKSIRKFLHAIGR